MTTHSRHREKTATDRDLIAAAFTELANRGYVIPFKGWEVCCTSCGWAEFRRQAGLEPGADFAEHLRTVWWHEQADAAAFTEGNPSPHTPDFLDGLPDDLEEAVAWIDLHGEEVAADSFRARQTLYADLRGALHLHWLGNADEIVAALRAQGLRVHAPEDSDMCISVLPDSASMAAVASGGDVEVRIGAMRTVLAVTDAKRLARLLNSAARRAAAQDLPLLD